MKGTKVPRPSIFAVSLRCPCPCFALLTFECGVWLTVTKRAVSGSSSSRAIYGFFNFKHFTFHIDCSHTALARRTKGGHKIVLNDNTFFRDTLNFTFRAALLIWLVDMCRKYKI